ncbi:MAG: hypothetical protein GF381_00635 [Candidatus Pacebacteria bacterium]|nr:hypothetical protein [Candidatus Paceibacterota bacterium]
MKRFLITNQLSIVVSLLAFVLIISAVSSYFYFSQPGHNPFEKEALNQTSVKSKELTQQELQKLEQLNVLLLGYGGPGHEGGYLTDVIQIVQVDFKKMQIGLISIPRDLWVKLPNGQQSKINQAFTLAADKDNLVKTGGEAAKQMASVVTGLPIDYFVAVDFVGFQRLIGINLGRIEVQVKETLNDRWYPIKGQELNPCGHTPQEIADLTARYSGFELEKQFPCRYEHVLFEPGLVKMEGGEALKFVRSRHGSAGGDFSRSQRAQAVLKGIKNKLFSLKALEQAPEFFNQAKENFTTDLNLEAVKYLGPAIGLTQNYQIKQVILSTENVLSVDQSAGGQFVVRPKAGENNWSQVQQFVQESLD